MVSALSLERHIQAAGFGQGRAAPELRMVEMPSIPPKNVYTIVYNVHTMLPTSLLSSGGVAYTTVADRIPVLGNGEGPPDA
jgi:hypothetical protein